MPTTMMQIGGIQKRFVPKTKSPPAQGLVARKPMTENKALSIRAGSSETIKRPNAYSTLTSSAKKKKRVLSALRVSAEDLLELQQYSRNKALASSAFTDDDHEKTTNDKKNNVKDRVDHLPVFSIDDDYNQEHYLNHYNVQRLPVVMLDSMDAFTQDFLQHIMERCRKLYKNSSWLIVWEHDTDDGWSILPQQQREKGEYANLEKMLETGKLHGCDLRGNPITDRFGLVANRKLAPRTVVAVECGVLYSEQNHDALVKRSSDPIMAGLVSNFIEPTLLKRLASAKYWKSYRNRKYHDRIPGLVMDSASHGNETKFIGDWNFTSDPGDGPNLESFAVVDLKHSVITVAFETNRTVEKGEELVIDLGCWDQVCNDILPGQAQLSRILDKRCRILEDIAMAASVPIDSEKSAVDDQEEVSPIFFNAKNGLYGDIEDYGIECTYGKEFELLQKLRDEGADTIKFDFLENPDWGVPAPNIIDPSFDGRYFAIHDTDRMLLSEKTLAALQKVPPNAGTGFHELKNRVMESYERNIEVVEIVDERHPAKLFCLPGRKSYGVRAKRNILKGAPILCYGGTIEQFSSDTDTENSYIYAITEFLPDEYEGPNLYINGSRSIGGKLNDSWSPTDDWDENVTAIQHWDETTSTPQLVFRASRDIMAGEELLYDYGSDYWKIMFKRLVEDHAHFGGEKNERCKVLRKKILAITEWDADYLRQVEKVMLSATTNS